MAVPKRKKSKSRIRMRKAHLKQPMPAAKPCPKCGEPHLAHRVCPACGSYNGRQVLIKASDED
ncbi:MAG: 50S ribosomal protein L32 [Verrucomicrobia bacterium]|nr:MAG: 50S ribosomal protein L32 [Verrucomicrobiota bacterium]